MKRFFYGALVATLIASGCNKEAEKPADDLASLASEESMPISVEEEALRDLAGILERAEKFALAEDLEAALEERGMTEDQFPEIDQQIAWADETPGNDFHTINFARNDEIVEGQEVALQQNIELARQAVDAGKHLILKGHASQLEPHAVSLSERRAHALEKEFLAAGIPANSMTVVGVGAEEPLAWTTAQERAEQERALAMNNRTEVVIG